MKRPMVWGVGLLFLCFLIRITFFNKQVQKEQYCLNALFDREAFCNAIGTIEQIEQKKNSVFIYLKDVLYPTAVSAGSGHLFYRSCDHDI